MSHTLILLRHAKADRPDGVADRVRPLTGRGRADAAAAGRWLAGHGYAPRLVLCSPAARTRQTWSAAAGALAAAGEVRYEERLYTSGVTDLLYLLAELPEEADHVLMVGHNPTISDLSARLDPARADSGGLRTCALAVHVVDSPWAACGTGIAARTAGYVARG